MNILQKIIDHKKEEVALRKKNKPLSDFEKEITVSSRNFKEAISKKNIHPNLISEIKKASPSEGIIRPNFDIEAIATIYNKYAAAISVLTDEKFFGGDQVNLQIAQKHTTIPLLCKDFIIDEYQIYEARYYGADAILLIAGVLDAHSIERFIKTAKNLHLDCLVEVHSHEELKSVLTTSAEIIGINNRNLKTFETSLSTTLELAQKIPSDKIIVSESGFYTYSDLEIVQPVAHAALVGTSLMKQDKVEQAIKKLLHKM